jgi:hypothetical protein
MGTTRWLFVGVSRYVRVCDSACVCVKVWMLPAGM